MEPLKARLIVWFVLFLTCVIMFNYLAFVIGGRNDAHTPVGFLKLTIVVVGLIAFVITIPPPPQEGEKK